MLFCWDAIFVPKLRTFLAYLGFFSKFWVSSNPYRFESFSYNNKDLLFEWVEEGALGSSNINNISLAQFNVFSGLVVIPTPIDSLDKCLLFL